MIEGLKIDLSSDEIKKHLEDRAAYHQSKTEWYAGQVGSLKSGGISETYHSNDPVGSLQRSMEEHRQKCAFFKVMAEHIISGEIYRLTQSDLATIEIISHYF